MKHLSAEWEGQWQAEQVGESGDRNGRLVALREFLGTRIELMEARVALALLASMVFVRLNLCVAARPARRSAISFSCNSFLCERI
jgi:hypothetical protein